jgi:hypothetical protein
MGTGINPSGIPGKKPKIIKIAVIMAARVNFLVR